MKKNFIQILDEYQDKTDFQYFDLLNILKLSQMYYNTNGLGNPDIVGSNIRNRVPIHFQNHLLSNVITPDDTETYDIIEKTPSTPLPSTPIKKYKKNIDIQIKSFSDLLAIVNEYTYDEETEYNIDLKALIAIKDELETLNNMIGMSKLKDAILDQILYFMQYLHHGKNPDFMHTILSGPPGTGKTEVAKILGKMYSKVGILNKGIFKKVTRSDLIAGYLGQTAIKTSRVIEECLGGCLFIDEAYSLASDGYTSDIYSKECLDTLCEALSNHKGELMVIIAGYEEELNNTFFKVNQGLRSRFIWKFKIDEYSAKELLQIFFKKIQENDWSISVEESAMISWFDKRKDHFKFYGRDMELLFSYVKIAHGRRIYGKPAELKKQINLDDMDAGHTTFVGNIHISEKRTEIFGLYV